MSANFKPVVIVAGPTASGKSDLAVAAAEAAAEAPGMTGPGVVINADSMQVYAELPILSGAPGTDLQARAPHRLYGIRPVDEPCSAGLWRDLASQEIETAHSDGRLPVVCGGTGLYLKALMEGLSPIPDVPGEVRTDVLARLASEGPEALHVALSDVDPAAAARLAPGDGQRIARALMVQIATGTPLSDWQGTEDSPPGDWRFLTMMLDPPRADLYPAIEGRFDQMLAAGALDEVRGLMDRKLDPGLPGMKALGVPDLIAHLEGRLDLEATAEKAKQATRNYAKRQITWFRNQFVADHRFNEQFSERINQKVRNIIRQFLLTAEK